ncbi:diguanylate cyclase, partial [Pseudomonas protegens]|uniref:diguanylate cyclase n=1 Tax=Pseudomonas protegens TaxID=380021 RepID=UPI00223C493E
LPDVPLEHAADLMEALRGRFAALGYEQSPTLQVSLSIGLAAFNPVHEDAMGWLNDADQALYAAKTGGRNNVTCHPPELPSRRVLNPL